MSTKEIIQQPVVLPSKPATEPSVLTHFHSMGHYPDRFVKLTPEEVAFVEEMDKHPSNFVDRLNHNPQIKAWFKGITGDKSRLVDIPSFCEYC